MLQRWVQVFSTTTVHTGRNNIIGYTVDLSIVVTAQGCNLTKAASLSTQNTLHLHLTTQPPVQSSHGRWTRG